MGNWGGSGGVAQPLTYTVYGDVMAERVNPYVGTGNEGRMQARKYCFWPGNPADCITSWPTGAGVYVLKAGDTMTGTLYANAGVDVLSNFRYSSAGNSFHTGGYMNPYWNNSFIEVKDNSGSQNLKFLTSPVTPNVGTNALQIRVNNDTNPLARTAYFDSVKSSTVHTGVTMNPPAVASIGWTANTPGTNNQRVGGYIGYCPSGGTYCAGFDMSAQGSNGQSYGVYVYHTSGSSAFLGRGNAAVYGYGNPGGDFIGNPTAINARGSTYGIYAQATTTGATAGYFANPTYTGYGVRAVGGIAVKGDGNQGAQFTGNSGYGVYAEGGPGSAGVGAMGGEAGVRATGTIYGIVAEATNNSGFRTAVYASSSNFAGWFTSPNGTGIRGEGTTWGGAFYGGDFSGVGGMTATGYVGVQGNGGPYGGTFTGYSYGIYAYGQDWYGVYGVGNTAGLYGYENDTGAYGYVAYANRGASGYGDSGGVYGYETDTGASGYLGNLNYGLYSNRDIYSYGSKGVVLNAADSPMITRGWDAFTSGAYSGLGRWGLFMEPAYLTLGYPNVAGRGVKVSRYNADSTKTDILTIDSSGNLTVNVGSAYKPGGGSWLAVSDARVKNVLSDFTYGLDELGKLQPIVFTYKENNPKGFPSDEKHVGFVAQEVEKVLPEAVKTVDGLKVLDQDVIIWTMLNSIKELKAENDSLKTRIESLERE